VRPLKIALVAVFVACIPVFLVTSNVRWVINAPFLYSYGFDKYDIPERTGIEREELIKAGAAFRNYFNNDDDVLDVRVVQDGVLRSIYNAREIAHMSDVKGLVKGVWDLQTATGGFIGAFLLVGAFFYRRRWLRMVARFAGWGGLATLGLVVAAGIGVVIGFDRLFLAFHLISFSNDLWQLDPGRDMLLIMFPQGFFLDATLWIVGSTIVQALALSAYPVVRFIRGFMGTSAPAEGGALEA
jgi:integral membrane protein (TIGR01906 family)